MEDQKPWPGLALTQDFAERRGLKAKTSNLENVLSEVVQLKRITNGGLGTEHPAAKRFLKSFRKKKAILMSLDHI